jgi:hypothetical protein
MGRGRNIKRVKDFLREPYISVIELYLDTKNQPLRFDVLRYLLLENHGLKMIIDGTTRGEKFVSQRLFFRDRVRSMRTVRSILLKEGRVLLNTTGPNRGKSMNVSGLNRLLQRMEGSAGPEILTKTDEGYELTGNPFQQYVRMGREERISSCPDDMVCELGHGLTIYNFPKDEEFAEKLKREDELYEGVRRVGEEVVKLWAKRKVSLFIVKLRAHKSVHDNGNFLGYCCEVVRWFVGSLSLSENDFDEELNQIEKIARDHRTKKEARAYGEGVRACKEVLKETKMKIAISYPPIEKGTARRAPEIVEASLLNVPIILSRGQDAMVADTIRKLAEDGIMGKMAGELLLLDQEMSKLYRKHELDEYLGSATLSEEPIIVIDSH